MMRTASSNKELLLLDLLARSGCLTIEQVAAALPELTWCELFHIIDDLSRRRALLLRRRGFEYEVAPACQTPAPTH